MKRLFSTLAIAGLFAHAGVAQSLPWSPKDFEPLTGLPWVKNKTPMREVITTIFREPRLTVRYAVLAEYLREIPTDDFNDALELCTDLEGTQHPDELVYLILSIWTSRDPEAAWEKTKQLFDLCVIQGEPLDLDNWTNGKITVVNIEALRASKFWLRGFGVEGFVAGIEKLWHYKSWGSGQTTVLPRARRIQLLQEFNQRYITAFAITPGRVSHSPYGHSLDPYAVNLPEMIIQALTCPAHALPELFRSGQVTRESADVAAIRWLSAEPSKALDIIAEVAKKELLYETPLRDRHREYPSLWFLQQWKRLDPPAMKRWTEKRQFNRDEMAEQAYGMLMSDVDADTRKLWLKKAEDEKSDDGCRARLLMQWAEWNPADAFQALDEKHDQHLVGDVLQSIVYPENGQIWNRSPWGLRFVDELDWARQAPFMLKALLEESGIIMMEQWVDVDVGQAARFAFKTITTPGAPQIYPRQELIKEFSGGAPFSGDDFNDRCFCALRFWAMWKPDEMRKWIATVQGADMQKALTWLLEHPWGTGPEPE